jgi:hypothetical protein
MTFLNASAPGSAGTLFTWGRTDEAWAAASVSRNTKPDVSDASDFRQTAPKSIQLYPDQQQFRENLDAAIRAGHKH